MLSETKQTESHQSAVAAVRVVRMRSVIAVILSMLFILSAFSVMSPGVNAASASIIAKTTAYLNLRSGAGTSYSVIKVIDKGASVTIVDRSKGDWPKVKLSDGSTGYCSADYLTITTPGYTTAYLNLRSGAGTGYGIIKLLDPNTKLTINRFVNNTWSKVSTAAGTTGYVSTDYVSFGSAVQPVTLSLSSSTNVMAVGKTFQFKAAGNEGTVKWSTTNASIITITTAGLAKAVAAGTAKIVLTDTKTKKSISHTIKAEKTDFTSIKLNITEKTIFAPNSFNLTATTNTSSKKIKFESSDTSVAKVDSNGKVTGVGWGTAKIYASDLKGIVKAKCIVTVKTNDSIKLSHSSISVTAGSSFKLTATKSNPRMQLKWSSNNLNVAGVANGVVSGLQSGRATITVSDTTGHVKATCTVTVNGISSGGVTLSRYRASTTAGKTIYIKGYNGAIWGTSDSAVATVNNGFIDTKNPGTIAVTYADYYGNKAICIVTVYDPAPVKFLYSSPNSATLNSTIKLIAITDKKRTKVDFYVKLNGQDLRVPATSKYSDGNTYVWSGYYTANKVGKYVIKAYACDGTKWETCNDGTSSIMVSSKTNKTTTSLDRLRPSDGLIDFIADKEGFVSSITYDYIAYYTPTIGHGHVVYEGQTFYNNLTRKEAYADLVNKSNNDVFASRVNDMLIGNGVRFNQQQFDALVSFSYNLGTGWTYSSDLRSILLRSGGNLNNVNRSAFTNEMLAYHHSAGCCYYGLLYRRVDEVEMFFYGDYTPDGRSNKYGFPSPYCISW